MKKGSLLILSQEFPPWPRLFIPEAGTLAGSHRNRPSVGAGGFPEPLTEEPAFAYLNSEEAGRAGDR